MGGPQINVKETAMHFLLWRQPKTTALVCIGINGFFILVQYLEYSFITLFTYFLLAVLTIGLATYGVWNWLTSDEEPEEKEEGSPEFDLQFIDEETVKKIYVNLYVLINNTLQAFRDIVMLKNFKTTLIVYGILLVVSFLGFFLSDLALLWIIVDLVFIIPIVYDKKKVQINEKYSNLRQKAKIYVDKTYKAIPKHKKEDE